MGGKGASTKTILKEHSKAKVKLYTDYLLLYLRILGNTHVSKIHLFDVLCGEGKYEDGSEGSALKSLRTILAYFTDTPHTKLKLDVRLNDFGQSDVETGLKKIERVKGHASSIPFPNGRVKLEYSDYEYSRMLDEVKQSVGQLSSSEKALIFIDPWGYKSISPKKLNELFACGRAEILMFLPTTHMYRFANKAVEDIQEDKILKCFLPLKRLLEELYDGCVPKFSNFKEFELALLTKLKIKLGVKFNSFFTLETEDKNKYSLFFFTPHIKGLEAFNHACWKLDEAEGKEFVVGAKTGQNSIFSGDNQQYGPVHQNHIAQLKSFIFSSPATNREIYEFGVVSRQLTKSTNAALNFLRESGEIEAEALDGQPDPKKKANYLDYNPKRIVRFKRKEDGTV
jgi:three-Cys-motif partner protein